jgi:hypothetical protein
MRDLGLFYDNVGPTVRTTRNIPYKLEDPHPVERYPDCQHSGNAGLDGYTLIDRCHPRNQGREYPVQGVIGRYHLGPSEDFEQ